MINKAAADNVVKQIEDTVKLDAKCVYGGKRTAKTIVEPAVLTDVTPDMLIAQDMEVFDPAFPVIGFDIFEEAIFIANNTMYSLSSGVMTENMKIALKVATQIKAGTCVINGTSYHGFGGYKMSGAGREGALHTLEEFSNNKTIVLRQVLA